MPLLIVKICYFQAKLQEKKRKLKHIKNIVESTESIPSHFSRRVKRTLSDDSLSKPSEPTVNNSKPVDPKSHEVMNNITCFKEKYLISLFNL